MLLLLYVGSLDCWIVNIFFAAIFTVKLRCYVYILAKIVISFSFSGTDSGSSSGGESDADKDSVVQKVWILSSDFISYLVLFWIIVILSDDFYCLLK